MAIVKMISSKSSFNLVHYILDGEAHNKKFTNDRNLYVNGHNIFTDYQNKFNSNYIASQFYAVRKVAGKIKKRTQVFHNIYSFSDNDFPPTDDSKELQKQAKQAYKLVDGFLKKQLPKDSQYLIGIQRDGDGGKLHAHVALNSVLINGKTLDTNDLSLLQKVTVKQINKQKVRTVSKGVFEKIQDYLSDNFQKVTGRSYQRIDRDKSNLIDSKTKQITKRGGYVWKDDLKDRIIDVARNVDNLDDFKAKLHDIYGVDVKEYQASTGKVDSNGKKVKRLAYTYSFKDDSGKLHKSRDFRYTKKRGVGGLGTFARPQDLEQLVFLPKRQQEQQQENDELNEIVQNQITLDTVQTVERSVKNGTESPIKQQSTDTEETDFEPTYTGNVKAVNKVKVSEVKSTDYDTSDYDQQTDQLQQRNNEEIARRQQQEFIKLEQQRQERERKRKERERQRRQREQQRQRQQKQVDRHQTTTNGNQTKQYNDVESTINAESKSRNDEPDFGGLS